MVVFMHGWILWDPPENPPIRRKPMQLPLERNDPQRKVDFILDSKVVIVRRQPEIGTHLTRKREPRNAGRRHPRCGPNRRAVGLIRRR